MVTAKQINGHKTISDLSLIVDFQMMLRLATHFPIKNSRIPGFASLSTVLHLRFYLRGMGRGECAEGVGKGSGKR